MKKIRLEKCKELIEFIDQEMRAFDSVQSEDYDYERDLFINNLSIEIQESIHSDIIEFTNKAIKFFLHKGNDYVETTGSIESDIHEGTFYSLDELNNYVQKNWFDFGVDMRGKFFTEKVTRFEQKEKNGWSSYYVYYTVYNP